MNKLSRLYWQCRRGHQELDIVLNRYLTHQYSSATLEQQLAFQQLLTLTDAELLNQLFNDPPSDSTLLTQLWQYIRHDSI